MPKNILASKKSTSSDKTLERPKYILGKEVAEPIIDFLYQDARRFYKTTLEHQEKQPVEIPIDAINPESNTIMRVIINGVRYTLKRGYVYFLPQSVANIVMEKLNLGQTMKSTVKRVAQQTVGGLRGQGAQVEVTIDGEKVL